MLRRKNKFGKNR